MSYYQRGMVPPPPEPFLVVVGKAFIFLMTLPFSLPMMLMRLRERFSKNSQSQYWNPFGGEQEQDYQNYQNYQDRQNHQNYQDGAQYSSNSSNQGYGKRMVWTYVPGFGWRYTEVNFGPEEGRN